MLETSKEIRKLSILEFIELIDYAPQSEVKRLKDFLKNRRSRHPYEFFKMCALEQNGLIINDRPIYFGALTKNMNGTLELWTIVNSNIDQYHYTLYKETKRCVMRWAKKYPKLQATMNKGNEVNVRWTERLGFKQVRETEDTLIFELEGGK